MNATAQESMELQRGLDELARRFDRRLAELDDYPETEYGRGLGIVECLEILKKLRAEMASSSIAAVKPYCESL